MEAITVDETHLMLPGLTRCGKSVCHLVVAVLLQEVSGHVAGQDVPQHVLIVFSQLFHLVNLLLGLDAPQEVQPSRVLQLHVCTQQGNFQCEMQQGNKEDQRLGGRWSGSPTDWLISWDSSRLFASVH